MLDFYRRCWHIFLPLSVLLGLGSLQAFYYLKEYACQWGIIITLIILATIFFVMGCIGCIKAFQYARKEERETKAAKDKEDREAKTIRDYEALKESFRRVHPEWTEEQLEIATRGRPSTPPIEEEGEGNS